MQIIWHGQSCFEIATATAKNNQIKIIIDPLSEEFGLKIPKLEADIVIVTHNRYERGNVKAISGGLSAGSGQLSFLITGSGEYEIKNIFIQGISSLVAETSSQLPERGEGREMNKVQRTSPRPASRRPAASNKKEEEGGENTRQLEEIGDIDILMIPIGGIHTISAKEALRIMAQIEPKITIPMCYALPKLKIKLDGLDKFLKPLGVKSITPEPKLAIKQKDISSEEAKIVVLKP
jgi:hypothetical protein